MDRNEAELVARTEARRGVFGISDLRDHGLSDRWRDNRLRQGRIVAVHQGVYRFAGTTLTWEGELLAAVLAGSDPSAASHRSAAALHGIAGGNRTVIEITCRRWRRARHPGLLVHETKAFDDCDRTAVDGVPVTTPARTLLDLGAVLDRPIIVEMALDDALRKRLVSIAELRALLDRLGRPGRNGAGVLRKILDRRSPGRPTESPQELRMIRMLVRNGLPEPVRQFEVRTARGTFVARVDAAYPQWRIAVEYDSDAHHDGSVARRRDDARRLGLRGAGWEVVSVNADALKSGGAAVCVAIRQIIRERDPLWRRRTAMTRGI